MFHSIIVDNYYCFLTLMLQNFRNSLPIFNSYLEKIFFNYFLFFKKCTITIFHIHGISNHQKVLHINSFLTFWNTRKKLYSFFCRPRNSPTLLSIIVKYKHFTNVYSTYNANWTFLNFWVTEVFANLTNIAKKCFFKYDQ